MQLQKRKHKVGEEFEILGRALLPDLLQDLSLKLHIVSRNKLDVVVPAVCRVLPSLGNFLFLSLLHP